MPHTHLRSGTRVAALVCSLAAAAGVVLAGCGDGPICQSESLVIIQSPTGVVLGDSNLTSDGVQTDVVVRTTFPEGVVLTLSVVDDNGDELDSYQQPTDRDGDATFTDVTVPATGADLVVAGDAGQCGSDDDTVHVEVAGGTDCELEFATPPLANDFYAPLDVLPASLDADAGTPGFQGDVVVRTTPGHDVRLFLSSPGTNEAAIGSGTGDASGEVWLAVDLPEGQDNLRVECRGPGGLDMRSSGVTAVMVDTVAPTCSVTSPMPTTSITPSLDADADLSNGIQLTLTGHADGTDVAGEPGSFAITAPGGGTTTLVGTDLDLAGDSTADASFAPAAVPADFGVAFSSIDHAGNGCSATYTYRVVYDGCPMVVDAPLAPVSVDADDNPANGAQIDIALTVDAACLGQTVTSDCGTNSPSGAVGVGGAVSLRADVCGSVPCESQQTCTVRVTSPDGIETTAGVDLTYDDLPPSVGVQVAAPSGVACGGVVTPAQDIDAAAGVQIRMRVVSPQAVDRRLQETNLSGTVILDANGAGGEVLVTLADGGNDFVGLATDAVGNQGSSATCSIMLSDIVVAFTGSPADGTVGAGDGTVSGSDLSFALTGTVSELGATVTVTVDGGAPLTATVTGTSWSLPLTLTGRAAPYDLIATATVGVRTGMASLALTVDLSPPPAVGGLTGVVDSRRGLRLDFTAPDDGGQPAAAYRVRYATVALTDANFDTTGSPYPGPTPAAPGQPQSAVVQPLRLGTSYWVAIAAVDAAGNRSTAQIAGPLAPAFDQSAALLAPNTSGNAAFGLAVAHGRFNDDGFDDVAVGAPYATSNGLQAAGEVYVYLGSAAGLATTPSLTIRGTSADGNLGAALTAVRWSSAGRDDLVIGEPGAEGFSGALDVFDGGAGFPSGTVDVTSAGRRIMVASALNWFSGSALGWQVARADHDGDGTDDLVATAIFGGGGTAGAALVFYGGTVPSGVLRLSDLSAAGTGSAVIRMYEQPGPDLFGYYLSALGPTQGVGDSTDDLAVAYVEDGLAGADLIVYRSAPGRPAAPGVTREPFTTGRDVLIRYATPDTVLEWGSAVGTIEDQNGDGARDIVIGDFRAGGDAGVVFVIDGDTVGAAGVAATDAAGVVITQLAQPTTTPAPQLGMAVLNGARSPDADLDGDGHEDLVIAARASGSTQAVLAVWFGPLPQGVQLAVPDRTIPGPAGFTGTRPNIGGSAITALWAGDVNADGLDDICWADWTSNGLDGSLQIVWDDHQ